MFCLLSNRMRPVSVVNKEVQFIAKCVPTDRNGFRSSAKYHILDTKDGIVEIYNYSDFLAVASKVKIKGVSLEHKWYSYTMVKSLFSGKLDVTDDLSCCYKGRKVFKVTSYGGNIAIPFLRREDTFADRNILITGRIGTTCAVNSMYIHDIQHFANVFIVTFAIGIKAPWMDYDIAIMQAVFDNNDLLGLYSFNGQDVIHDVVISDDWKVQDKSLLSRVSILGVRWGQKVLI